MRITPAGAATVASAAIPNGRLEVPGCYLQTGSENAVQLDSADKLIAVKIIPKTDWNLSAVAVYITAVVADGGIGINLWTDDGATDSSPGAFIDNLLIVPSGVSADTWIRGTAATAYQLQRGKPIWIVGGVAESVDISMSTRRWNTNVGSMFPDEMPVCKVSTDGGSNWSAATQDSKPAMWNIILNASANNVPPLIYGRYNGQYIYLPGVGIREIPEAGVSLACDALTADTLYYVYAYDDSGTLTLDASTSAPTLSEGILVKTGATTRRYVGMIYPKVLQSGYQGPLDVMDLRYVWNLDNRILRRFGKENPFHTTTGYIITIQDTWEKINNNDSWTVGLLSGGDTPFWLFLGPFSAENANVALGWGMDSVGPYRQHYEDRNSGNRVIFVSEAPSVGQHSLYAICKNVEPTDRYIVSWNTLLDNFPHIDGMVMM